MLEPLRGIFARPSGNHVNPDGNERLTAAVGVLVVLPVLVEIATVLLGVHTFMSTHVFAGLALIPAVLLKLASTGWRFARYYTRNRAYLVHGPPRIAMRLLAPLFVAATVVLFGSGVAMGLLHGQALQIARRLHGPASVVWLVLLGLHVLVYLRRALWSTAEDALPARRRPLRGTTARAYAVVGVVVVGIVVGAATVPAQHRWVDLPRHDRHDDRKGASALRAPALLGSAPVSVSLRRPRERRSAPCGWEANPPSQWRHVIWIWMENESYNEVIDTAATPYLTQLAHLCGLATDYSAVSHPRFRITSRRHPAPPGA